MDAGMNVEQAPPAVQRTPRPFGEIPPLWARLGRMSENFFASEMSHASARNTFLAVLILTGSLVLVTIISAVVRSAVTRTAFPPTNLVLLLCVQLAITPMGFYLRNGMLYIAAEIFGGNGSYESQAYLVSVYYVPLVFLQGLAALLVDIQYVGIYAGGVVSLALAAYGLLLSVRVLKVVHSLTTGMAIGIGAAVAVLVLLLVLACIVGALVLLGPLVGNAFSAINAGVGTPTP